MADFSEVTKCFAIYENAIDFYGIADITLPSITQLTESMEGAGVAGKYDAIISGHIEAMKMSLSFRNPTKDAFKLFTPEIHQLDLRAVIQERNSTDGVKDVGVKHVIKAEPINLDLGNVKMYSSSDTKSEFAVTYFATYMDGEEKLMIDPFNYIYRVNGKDYLDDVRKKLGKA